MFNTKIFFLNLTHSVQFVSYQQRVHSYDHICKYWLKLFEKAINDLPCNVLFLKKLYYNPKIKNLVRSNFQLIVCIFQLK